MFAFSAGYDVLGLRLTCFYLADMGVFEALGQSYSDVDLAAFQKQYGIPRQKVIGWRADKNRAGCQVTTLRRPE